MTATTAATATHVPGPPGSSDPAAAAGALRRRLEDLLDGNRRSQLVYVAARLALADVLKDGPRTSADLATACDCAPGALHRALRAMVAIGLLDLEGGRFGLTALGQCLRTDAPQSLRGRAILCGETQYPAFGALLYGVRTGQSAFDHVFGVSAWEYRAQRPELAEHFHQLMAARTAASAGALRAAYDFAPFRTVVDVGGGNGALLAEILRAQPHLRGILLDAPLAISGARSLLADAGVAHRCDAVPGDFFVSVPDGGDLYLLKSVLHNWEDEPSAAILRNCRRVMPPHGRLLLVEHVISDEAGEAPAVVQLDLQMLVMLGGRQRTEAEFRTLLRRSGFELARVLPTATGASLLEAVPATGATHAARGPDERAASAGRADRGRGRRPAVG